MILAGRLVGHASAGLPTQCRLLLPIQTAAPRWHGRPPGPNGVKLAAPSAVALCRRALVSAECPGPETKSSLPRIMRGPLDITVLFSVCARAFPRIVRGGHLTQVLLRPAASPYVWVSCAATWAESSWSWEGGRPKYSASNPPLCGVRLLDGHGSRRAGLSRHLDHHRHIISGRYSHRNSRVDLIQSRESRR